MSTLLFFLFVLLFVTTNMVLGCYLAIVLGYGPPGVRATLELIVDPEQIRRCREFVREKIRSLPFPRRRNTTDEPHVSDTGPAGETASADESVGEATAEEQFTDMLEKLASADVGDLLDDESEEITDLAPMHEIFDEDLASALEEQGTEVWLVNEKHVETSLLKLNVVMMKSGRFASELDWRIRSARGLLGVKDVKQFRDELLEDCRNYLDSQASITEQMQKRLDEFGELKYLAEQVDDANLEQAAQIETTQSNLANLDLNKDPEELGNDLIKELSNLRIARHRLRDMQDRTFMKIVFYENRLDTIPQQLYFDENFGIRGRIGLEVAIHEWWKQKRNQTRQITFALIDFVRFGELNIDHGIEVCDKIIKQFGRALEEHFDTLDLVGIYNGNCFMVATINMGPKKTITEIERVRQRCEKTIYSFNGGNDSLRLQVTCAITEALGTQSQKEVMEALEKTLVASKKAGRNHTFHYVPGPLDKPPEKVEAPNLGEEEKTISLD